MNVTTRWLLVVAMVRIGPRFPAQTGQLRRDMYSYRLIRGYVAVQEINSQTRSNKRIVLHPL